MPRTLPKLAPIAKYEPVTGRPRKRLAAAVAAHYRAGSSIMDIAGRIDRSFGFVRQLLIEQGVTIRPRNSGAV